MVLLHSLEFFEGQHVPLIRAIPSRWKSLVRQEGITESLTTELREARVSCRIGTKDRQIATLRTKELYSLGLTSRKPKALLKWESERIAPEPWPDFLVIPYKCCASTQLQSFQYQVIHRYLPTRRFLFVRHIIDSQECTYCGEIDTLVHHLYNCQPVYRFWCRLFGAVNRRIGPSHMDLDSRTVVFGARNVPGVVNLIILLAKRYVYLQRMNGSLFYIEGVLRQVQQSFEAEHIIAVRDNRADRFYARWQYFREGTDVVL